MQLKGFKVSSPEATLLLLRTHFDEIMMLLPSWNSCLSPLCSCIHVTLKVRIWKIVSILVKTHNFLALHVVSAPGCWAVSHDKHVLWRPLGVSAVALTADGQLSVWSEIFSVYLNMDVTARDRLCRLKSFYALLVQLKCKTDGKCENSWSLKLC